VGIAIALVAVSLMRRTVFFTKTLSLKCFQFPIGYMLTGLSISAMMRPAPRLIGQSCSSLRECELAFPIFLIFQKNAASQALAVHFLFGFNHRSHDRSPHSTIIHHHIFNLKFSQS